MLDDFYLAAICAVIPGLGRAKLPKLIKYLGSAKNVFTASDMDLFEPHLLTNNQIANFLSGRDLSLPEKLEHFCYTQEVNLITYHSDAYPQCLREINGAPLVLYVKGRLPKEQYSLAVVGSRAASVYGLRVARYFASYLAAENIPIISGGARGVDAKAHEACIQAGGRTVAVLGCGVDRVYPPEHKRLYQEIVASGGALVTEFPPGTPPLANNFPARNRIIAGLSQGILVAEAAKRSGAIITANLAVDAGRDVFCVPGNIFDGTSLGCHELIRTGAKLVDTPQDILEEYRSWQTTQRNVFAQQDIFAAAEIPQPNTAATANVSEFGQSLLALLQGGALSLEELMEQSRADFATISMELLDLQVANLVAVDKAQRYYRR